MRALTRNIGSASANPDIAPSMEVKIERVLISRPNSRLGNQILMTPLVQEVVDAFPDCKVDLFVRGRLAPILFENYANVDRIIRLPGKPFKELIAYLKVWVSLRKYRYDLVINVDKSSSSGRLSTQFAKGRFKFFCDADEDAPESKLRDDYKHIAKFPVYNLRVYLSKLGFKESDKPVPLLDIKLSASEIANGKEVLDKMVDSRKKTICIYTFATGSKCYTPSWWKPVYERLKTEYAERYNILEVLPAENVSQIDFEAISYYSRDIREIGSVIANTKVFIGADSGIMHLASAAKTPTVGLFSGANIAQYRPYGNHSLPIDTNTTDVSGLIEAIDTILAAVN